MNRLNGLDLVNRVFEELWTEVCSTVQETVNKTIPKKEKIKKAKWLSEEALQIAKERREVKSKGETERYTQLSTGFQRRARRDKKAVFNEQCKEMETTEGEKLEISNKMGNSKGTFHPKIDIIKDRNDKDIIEAEETKKR